MVECIYLEQDMAKQTLSHILEQGKVYFFYRPKVSDEAVEEWIPKGIEDVQRFYMVLKSDQDAHYRLLIIGKKRLPVLKKHEKYWGVVDMVTTRKYELINALKESHYQTKTRGERVQPEVKECGEGRYYIVKHGKNTFLNYRLSLPKQTGKVQRVFQIAPIANYQISMKN